jgi:hypothetical protein
MNRSEQETEKNKALPALDPVEHPKAAVKFGFFDSGGPLDGDILQFGACSIEDTCLEKRTLTPLITS